MLVTASSQIIPDPGNDEGWNARAGSCGEGETAVVMEAKGAQSTGSPCSVLPASVCSALPVALSQAQDWAFLNPTACILHHHKQAIIQKHLVLLASMILGMDMLDMNKSRLK